MHDPRGREERHDPSGQNGRKTLENGTNGSTPGDGARGARGWRFGRTRRRSELDVEISSLNLFNLQLIQTSSASMVLQDGDPYLYNIKQIK